MGPFSITGQPNAMGGREVGALSNTLAAHMDFAPADIDRVGRFWRAARMATQPGLKAVDLFDAVGRGEIKAVWIMATNPVASLPNADAVRAALKGCELRSSPRRCAPATPSMPAASACRRSPGRRRTARSPTPSAASRASGRSCRRPARRGRIGGSSPRSRGAWVSARPSPGESAADIFREHAAPFGLRERRHARLRHRRLCRSRRSRLRDAGALRLAGAGWRRRAAAASSPRAASSIPTGARASSRSRRARRCTRTDGERPLRLNTGRVRDQWHTMTRTGKSVRLAGHRPEPTIELHPHDAARARSCRRRHRRSDQRVGPRRLARACYGCVTARRRLRAHALDGPGARAPAASTPRSIPRSIRSPASPSSSTRRSRFAACRSSGMARFSLGRPVMLPEVSYWARIKGAGYHAWMLAGEQPLEQRDRRCRRPCAPPIPVPGSKAMTASVR